MVAGNDFVCPDGFESPVVLQGEILSDGPCPVTHEKVRIGQVALANKVVYEVVQCRLVVKLKYFYVVVIVSIHNADSTQESKTINLPVELLEGEHLMARVVLLQRRV